MKTKKEILGNTNCIKSKFVDCNTLKIDFENGSSSIRFHNTDIITFNPDNTIVLNSGGYRTPTTKDRINKFSPVRLYQNKGFWYFNGGSLFYDNCIINNEGKLLSKPLNNEKTENKVKKLKKQISDYCNLITKDNLPLPEPGDCWLCLFMDKEGKETDHLLTHIREKYLHGSIIVNAMRENNYRDEQISLFFHMKLIDQIKRSVRKYLQKHLISNIAIK
jgi:hypothetical protein